MLTLKEAIDVRKSHRNYTGTPLTAEQASELEALVARINEESGLSVKLIQNSPSFFKNSFTGVQGASSYFALIGQKKDIYLLERVGYYGEQIVLSATAMGLGTCWVSVYLSNDNSPCEVADDETLVMVIAVGEVAEEITFDDEFARNRQHRSSRPIGYFYDAIGEVPAWFIEGMEAVAKAPSHQNTQPVKFFYKQDKILAYVDGVPAIQNVDLGIAECHFEVATGKKVFNK